MTMKYRKAIAFVGSDGLTKICYPDHWDRHVWVTHTTRTVKHPHGKIPGQTFRRPVRVGDVRRDHPDWESKIEWAETEDEFLARVMRKSVPPDATDVQIVDIASIPQDRTYRNALRPNLSFDMDKARDIHKDMMRRARQPMLEALDVSYQRADESGDSAAKQAIVERKKALRDITADPAIEAAKTPAELSKIWPF